MKLTAVLAGLTLASSATALTIMEQCAKNNPDVMNSIGIFCQKTNMVIPSTYANNGQGKGGYHVGITGNCKPAQWVPQQYCFSQFYEICGNSPDGSGTKNYGTKGCQAWLIEGPGGVVEVNLNHEKKKGGK